MNHFLNITTTSQGVIEGERVIRDPTQELNVYFPPMKFAADLRLLLIREAWEAKMNVEDLADGFGLGLGTCGGDWSGIRDSSNQALDLMLERALNFIHDSLRS